MVIIGSKGCAKEILTALKWDNVEETVSLFDNINTDISDAYYDFPIIKSWNELEQHLKTDSKVIIGVGGGQRREVLARKIACLGGVLTTFISQKALVGGYDNTIEPGVVILSGATITCNVSIGQGTFINKSTVISHDVRIGRYCEVSPGAKVLGRAIIGDRTEIGANAVILPDVIVGADCKIGAGAVVTRNIDSHTTVAGVPARSITKSSNNAFKLKSKIRNLLYHIRIADFRKLREYNHYVFGKRKLMFLELLSHSWMYGASFENYYELQFFKKSRTECRQYLTSSLRHELTRQVNDPCEALVLKDKVRFSEVFEDILGRRVMTFDEIKRQMHDPYSISINEVVIKPIKGQAGQGIIFPMQNFTSLRQLHDYVISTVKKPDEYLYEERIIQHSALNKLNPSSLNTLRIVTYYDESINKVDVWSVVLRIGIKARTDNFATGGIAVLVDHRGVVCQPAIIKHPSGERFHIHLVSGEKITGCIIPYYDQAIALAKQAAMRIPKVRSIGWDVAITETGPYMLEGNDNWCMTLFQLPGGEGLRHLANSVCNMFSVYE